MKATDYIAQFLAERGVSCVFEMSGGMITHLLDSIHLLGKTRIVSVHHEQAAAFAAEGWARMTGVPGVAMATSGPGATNLITGIGSCHFDSTPAVFITGQVNRHEQKGDKAIRQLGFQETDIVTMVKPITKAAWMIQEPEDIPVALAKAFAIATSGRPGPVLLDIPMDVQRGQVTPPAQALVSDESELPVGSAKGLLAALAKAKKPLILAGGGIQSGRATESFRQFVEAVNVPVVHSLMAVDVLPYSHPLRVGMIGSYGNRWANHALGQADLLIVLGSRLDVRQTGSETAFFKGERTIYHVDCEPGEMNNRVIGCETILSELGPFLANAITEAADVKTDTSAWQDSIAEQRAAWPDTKEINDVPGINPNIFMHRLSAHPKATAASAYVIDVGQHQMWSAQSLELGESQRFLTSGGMGAMGFALPTSIGVAFATPGKPVVVVAGDGAFQTNIQELQTIFRNQLPVKIVIIDNGVHGMVRQFQQSYFDGRYQSTMWGYSAPDFAAVAQAYGIASSTVESADGAAMASALDELWAHPSKPALLTVKISPEANAYPKIAFGRPLTEMEPFAKPLDMEGT